MHLFQPKNIRKHGSSLPISIYALWELTTQDQLIWMVDYFIKRGFQFIKPMKLVLYNNISWICITIYHEFNMLLLSLNLCFQIQLIVEGILNECVRFTTPGLSTLFQLGLLLPPSSIRRTFEFFFLFLFIKQFSNFNVH